MDARDELIALESGGWKALSTDAAAAVAFYGRVLDDAVVMLLPGGMRLDDRETILHSMGGAPWLAFHQQTPR